MSDNSTSAMPILKCTYCGNYHNYSVEMCRDMHNTHTQPGMFSEVTINAPCNECEHRKAAALRADAWVSVKERMPDEGIEVMTYSVEGPHHYHDLAFREGDIFTASWTPRTLDRVTHWRPLPPAPEQKT